jgi:hypothetical protein
MRFNKNSLLLNDNVIKEFEFPIKSIVEFKNLVVVLLDQDYYKRDNENVFCVNKEGVIIWQVPKYEYSYDDSPFVNITKDSQNIKLWNWDSSFVIIEPDTGKVITTAIESRKGRRPW